MGGCDSYQHQRKTDDCLRTTVSNLLNIKYEYVPDMYERSDYNLKKFCNKKNYTYICLDETYNNIVGKGIFIPELKSVPKLCVGALFKQGTPVGHAVIVRLLNAESNCSLEIEHDPGIGSTYSIGDLRRMRFIIKKPIKSTLIIITNPIKTLNQKGG